MNTPSPCRGGAKQKYISKGGDPLAKPNFNFIKRQKELEKKKKKEEKQQRKQEKATAGSEEDREQTEEDAGEA